MAKNNIRSIRMSDRVMEIIEAQAGDNFTAKFEALVMRCMWELPEKEKQLERIGTEIEEKRRELRELSDKAYNYKRQLGMMTDTMERIGKTIAVLAKDTRA